jgi:hypothetical protein
MALEDVDEGTHCLIHLSDNCHLQETRGEDPEGQEDLGDPEDLEDPEELDHVRGNEKVQCCLAGMKHNLVF